MKKLFFIVFALIAVSFCSSSEVKAQYYYPDYYSYYPYACIKGCGTAATVGTGIAIGFDAINTAIAIHQEHKMRRLQQEYYQQQNEAARYNSPSTYQMYQNAYGLAPFFDGTAPEKQVKYHRKLRPSRIKQKNSNIQY